MKAFFIIFHGLSVAKNCLRSETALLTPLPIKREILCNFPRTLEGCHFMGHTPTCLKFSITIDSSKLSSYIQSFKKRI